MAADEANIERLNALEASGYLPVINGRRVRRVITQPLRRAFRCSGPFSGRFGEHPHAYSQGNNSSCSVSVEFPKVFRNSGPEFLPFEVRFRTKKYAVSYFFELKGIRTRNGILSTLRSSVSSWAAVRRHVMRNAKPPPQSSGSSSTSLPVKRAVIEFWSVFFSLNNPWKA